MYHRITARQWHFATSTVILLVAISFTSTTISIPLRNSVMNRYILLLVALFAVAVLAFDEASTVSSVEINGSLCGR